MMQMKFPTAGTHHANAKTSNSFACVERLSEKRPERNLSPIGRRASPDGVYRNDDVSVEPADGDA